MKQTWPQKKADRQQPVDLLQALRQDESAETAVVYKEAESAIQQYKDVQAADLACACAAADLKAGGEIKRRTTFGSCGWTAPQSEELNKEAWPAAVVADHALAELEAAVARAQAALQAAQKPYRQRRAPAFYIR